MAVKFTGKPGEFVNGAPARDLTDEEFAALDPDVREHVIASNAFETDNAPKAAKREDVGTQPAPVPEAQNSTAVVSPFGAAPNVQETVQDATAHESRSSAKSR